MIKRKIKNAVRLVSSLSGVGVIASKKDGNLSESVLEGDLSGEINKSFAADDVIKLYDGKTLRRIRGILTIID